MWLRICSRHPVLFIPRPLIVKRGGHADQLSKSFEAMDKYRVRSLVKMLESGGLKGDLRQRTRDELRRKCAIIAQGARKRGRPEEAEEYLSLPDAFA
jgi:hypothetical protein